VKQLTIDQEKVVDAFFTFLLTEEKIFVLSGGAGVGKTFVMKHVSTSLISTYKAACQLMNLDQKYKKSIFTATTNKAASVLEDVIQEPVQTIHSFLKLKVHEDRKTGKTQLTKTKNWRKREGLIVFIDESSMIDSELYQIIKETLSDCKIVFVGDHAQMAPINEEVSPIYKDVAPKNFIFLDKPIRNAESPALINLCNQLRNTVETGKFMPIHEVPGIIEYLTDPQMQNKIKEYFLKPTTSARILCYTNSRVQTYNAHIRELRNLPKEFVPGEKIIFARNFKVTTLDIGPNVSDPMHRPTVAGEIIKTDRQGIITAVGPLSADDYHCSYHTYTIQTGLSGSVTVRVATDPDWLNRTMKHLYKTKNWAAYFHLRDSYADIRIEDACTVYKSQGATFETIFLDLGNIGTSFNAKQIARMLFVGASRASTRIYLYGKLPGRYTGWDETAA